MKNVWGFIFFLFYSSIFSFCNAAPLSKLDTCEKCKVDFLKKELLYVKGYSNFIYVPVLIGKSKVRIVISSENFHRYLSILKATNDSQINNASYLMDTASYLENAVQIIVGRKQMIFNSGFYSITMHNSNYTVLDKDNPYIAEINKCGLDSFLSKRMRFVFKIKDKNYYRLIDMEEYNNYDEYQLTYLYEALFNFGLEYLNGDGNIEFSKQDCLCSSLYSAPSLTLGSASRANSLTGRLTHVENTLGSNSTLANSLSSLSGADMQGR